MWAHVLQLERAGGPAAGPVRENECKRTLVQRPGGDGLLLVVGEMLPAEPGAVAMAEDGEFI